MTEAKIIISYFNRRRPKVTIVRIFMCRKNLSEIIIRLHVRNNDKSALLERQGFWPTGVPCKIRWTRTELPRPHNRGKVNANYNNYRIPKHKWSTLRVDYNTYT